MCSRSVGGDEFDDMAVIELAHGQRLLAQVLDTKASSSKDALPRKVDCAMYNFFDRTKCAISEIRYLDETRIETFRIGSIKQWFVAISAQKVNWMQDGEGD
jgi:hypothetical protein